MKKRNLFSLVFACWCLLAGAGVGMGIASFRDNAPMVVYAEGEETTEPTTNEEELTEEEKESKLQELLDQLNAKYQEIRDTQIFGTTIGAIIGAVVGAVVSLAPSLINRKNIKNAIEEVSLTRTIVDDNKKMAEKIKEDFNITNENYDKVITVMGDISKELKTTENLLKKVSDENDRLSHENAELKDILLNIVNHSKELVASGVAEALNKKYFDK